MEDIEKVVIRQEIARHIAPAEIVGDISQHEGEWRALVTLRPYGPLLLVAFVLTSAPEGEAHS